MKWLHIHPRPGIRGPDVRRLLALAATVFLTASCNYGFQGGGFPPHIRTVYIEPFENDTPQFDLTTRLYQLMVAELPSRLGVRVAGERAADAVLRGEIRRYDDVIQNYRETGDQPIPNVVSHEVQVQIAARLVDVRENVIRWEGTVTGRGTYRADQDDEVGKVAAIENLLEQIVDGAQSQW